MTDISVRRDRQLGAAWFPEMPPVVRRLGKTPAELLKAGICPICGAGPYTVPAMHASKMHGIDRREIRDMVGLLWREKVCDATHSAACAERARRRMAEGSLAALRPTRDKKRGLSKAAYAANLEKLAKGRVNSDPAELGRRSAKKRLAAAAPRDAEIVRRWQDGERMKQITDEMGIVPQTLRDALTRAGIENDAQARYWDSRRGVDSSGFKARRIAAAAQAAAEVAELVTELDKGVTVYELAERIGVNPRSLRGRLRRYGYPVPDGRSDPARKKAPPRTTKPPWPCGVDGCDHDGYARGVCNLHYAASRTESAKTGEPFADIITRMLEQE